MCRRIRTAMFVVALMSSVACDEGGPVRAAYSLRSIGGATLPLVAQERPFLEIVSRRITLYDDGSATHVAVWDTVPGPRSHILTATATGTYEIVDQVLEIAYTTPQVFYEEWRILSDGLRSQVGAVPEYIYLREFASIFGPE